MSFVDNYLEHFGVKGMRWGVRHRPGAVTLGRRAKPIPSEDKVKAEAARAKIGKRGNTDALTNQELQTLIGRINLETQLARYTAQQKKSGVGPLVGRLLKDTAKSEFDAFSKGKETKIIGTALALGAKGRHRKP